MNYRIQRSDAEWQSLLSPAAYAVCRQKATERPFSGRYWNHWAAGHYLCAGCQQPLFTAAAKFDAGCGWPSFDQPLQPEAVAEVDDRSHGMRRTEVVCSACGSHLGHVFDDGPTGTGLRYCINSLALRHSPEP